MAEITTPNYNWTMPDPGASANTWGATLNATTQKVDAQVFVNQQGLVPVGTIAMFAGPQSKLPVNWITCAGQTLDTTAYATLFALIGYMYGGSGASFNLPNFIARFPFGMTDGEHPYSFGGEATHTLAWGEMPAHQHSVPDPQHYHTINQGSHTHSDLGHNHGASAHQDPHSHGIPLDLVNPSASGLTSGGAAFGLASGQRTDTQQPGINVSTDVGNANLSYSGTGISNTDYAPTRISTTDVQGSGAAHNNMPPYLQINFIIRYQ